MKRSTRNKACMAASCHPCKYNITPPSTAYRFPPFNSTTPAAALPAAALPTAALPTAALMPAARNRRPFWQQDPDSPADPHTSDDFRMFEFKVRQCNRGRSHAWTDCPFAHPGEKARRRDPRRHNYYPDPCLDFRAVAVCPRGDGCPFSHGVFECWLHPARYRTQPCRDGRSCCRKVCFFAHSPGQLRPVPGAAASSPTSTLVSSLSHFASPVTPLRVDYKVLFEEIVSSLEAMELRSVSPGSFRTSGSGNVVLFSPPPNIFFCRMKGENVATAGDDGCPDLDWVEELLM